MRLSFAYPLLGIAALASLSLAFTACSSKHRNDTTDVDPEADGGTGTSDEAGGGFGGGGDSGTTDTGECNASTKSIYVVSEENTLYSFTPETLTFKAIGLLNCAAGGANPTSMAVDRQGTAWVLLSDGSISKVAVKDASCTSTTYAPGQSNFTKFGMGFATDATSGSAESLYLSDHFGKGLAKLDLNTLQLTTVGMYTGTLAGVSSELTGTGDGKLFGFFTTLPNSTIAEIDKKTGSILSMNTLANTPARTAWAFSFYAGVFYVYTAGDPSTGLPKDSVGSDVTLYNPADGSAKIVKSGVGFRIVGAGVSTCVPTSAVK